jgi:transcriptional regulator with XRE-family HTH domain
MKLADYLTKENMKPAHFAERMGVPASTVMRWLNGKRVPRLCSVALITKATKGKVTSKDFLSAPASNTEAA